jgi:hypothetical protein
MEYQPTFNKSLILELEKNNQKIATYKQTKGIRLGYLGVDDYVAQTMLGFTLYKYYGKCFYDLLILMLIGLLIICLYVASLYSDLKEWRKSENKIELLLDIILNNFDPIRFSGFLLGFIMFFVCFICPVDSNMTEGNFHVRNPISLMMPSR